MHVLKPDPVKEFKAAGWECAEPFRNTLTIGDLVLHQEGLCGCGGASGESLYAASPL